MQIRVMRYGVPTLMALAIFGALGCSGAGTDPTDATKTQSQVKPGSYEDWCVEHEVPESQCTRCNPSLIAAFKATNDWCDEHGLPESQCLPCNPGLKIERPPKPQGS